MNSRAIHEIQTEAMRLTTVNVTGAIEAEDWVALHRLAERLDELAQRGLYHAARERQQEIAQLAMRGHIEKEPR